MSPDDDFKLSPEFELEQIVSLQKAEKLSGLSSDSWKRHQPAAATPASLTKTPPLQGRRSHSWGWQVAGPGL